MPNCNRQGPVTFDRVELNITFECNLACVNCNRLCNLVELDKPMTVDQVALYVQRLRESGKKLRRTKVVGGEPTIHPQFMEICEVLSEGTRDGTVGSVTVNTNGTTLDDFRGKLPKGVRFKRSRPNIKEHLPMMWAPADVGMESHGYCKMPRKCGFSLDSRGWLPCSPGTAITRLFGKEHLYMPLDGPIPTTTWGINDLCPHCIFSTDMMRGKSLKDSVGEYSQASPTWANALTNWKNRMEIQ
jgi:hypothetical protein